jgi:hypothetical protein
MMDDQVERIFYVYLHKDKETGIPFFVGKGKGKRAFQTSGRGRKWKEHVDQLPNGFDVEIVKNEMTEGEAYEFEAKLIRDLDPKNDGSTKMVNVMAGGDPVFGEHPRNLVLDVSGLLDGDGEPGIVAKQLTKAEADKVLEELNSLCAEFASAFHPLPEPEVTGEIGSPSHKSYLLYYTIEDSIKALERTCKQREKNRARFVDVLEYLDQIISDLLFEIEEESLELLDQDLVILGVGMAEKLSNIVKNNTEKWE